MNLIKAIDETCIPAEGKSEEFNSGYHAAIIDVFSVLRKAQKILDSPPQTKEQESQRCPRCSWLNDKVYKRCDECHEKHVEQESQQSDAGVACQWKSCDNRGVHWHGDYLFCKNHKWWAGQRQVDLPWLVKDNGTGREES